MVQDEYILRIYRDCQNRRMIVGTVERVDGTMKSHLPYFTPFMDFEELRLLLGVPRGRPPRREYLAVHPSAKEFPFDGADD
jgi:hypothetical protein